MSTTKDYMATAKKQNSTILKARLKGGKFESPEEKDAYLTVLKLRGIDVSVYETPVAESAPIEGPEPIEVEKEKEGLSGTALNDAADEAYELCANENDQKKIALLAKVFDDGVGKAKEWGELTDENKLEIIKISKMKPEKKGLNTEKKEITTPKVKVEIGPFTEDQKVIAETESLTKAERVRQLYLLGCSVKQIASNTGWDYVNAYDTIKAYEKKQAKLAAEKSNELG